MKNTAPQTNVRYAPGCVRNSNEVEPIPEKYIIPAHQNAPTGFYAEYFSNIRGGNSNR
jgi:hypothetical protein